MKTKDSFRVSRMSDAMDEKDQSVVLSSLQSFREVHAPFDCDISVSRTEAVARVLGCYCSCTLPAVPPVEFKWGLTLLW